ncbi:uncharacterized protein V3H82_002007 [Fundulus diaphanus]
MLIEMDENSEADGDISTSEKRRKQAADIKGKRSADSREQSGNNTLRRSLQRGSSFTLLTTGPHWDFTLKRKHRQKDDGDTISICGSDFKKSKYRQKDDSDTISICSFDFKTLRVRSPHFHVHGPHVQLLGP